MSDDQMKTAPVVKTKQANIRLTAEQDRILKQYCIRSGMNTQAAIIDALSKVIPGFA
jgi:hypothetical protein